MKNNHLLKEKFKLGEQFYNWEFELDFLPQRVEGYDSFEFIGANTLYFLGLYVDSAELLFNADFLTAVILTFRKEECSSETLIERLSSVGYVSSESVLSYDVYISTNKNSPSYYVSKNCPEKMVYGKRRFMKKHLASL